MEKEIVAKWDKNKEKMEKYFATTNQNEYSDYSIIVSKVIELVLNEDDEIPDWDIKEVTEIDNGDYQGTKLFLFHKCTYQPNIEYYAILDVGYGSCSCCDTLEGIREYSDEVPGEDQVKGYMMLALHIIQRIKFLNFKYEN